MTGVSTGVDGVSTGVVVGVSIGVVVYSGVVTGSGVVVGTTTGVVVVLPGQLVTSGPQEVMVSSSVSVRMLTRAEATPARAVATTTGVKRIVYGIRFLEYIRIS